MAAPRRWTPVACFGVFGRSHHARGPLAVQGTRKPVRPTLKMLPMNRLSGVELYGEQAKLGLDLAAADINAAGGSSAGPSRLSSATTGPARTSRPRRRARWSRRTVRWRWSARSRRRISTPSCPCWRPTTPLLYATNYEGGKCNRYMFALQHGAQPGARLAAALHDPTFGNDYFLLGADRDWPHRMFDAAEPLIAKLGGKVVGKQYTLGAEKDFPPLTDRVADSKAKVLLYALKGDGMQFIPLASDRGLFKTMTVAFLGLTEADLKAFGGKVDNIYAAVPFVVASEDPKAKAFVARARAKAGPDMAISNYVETHYNTLIAVKAALEKAGKVDKEALVDALEGLTFELARRARHHRQGPSRHAQHVPRQDPGTATGAGPGARRDRTEVRLHTGSGRALTPQDKGRPEAALSDFEGDRLTGGRSRRGRCLCGLRTPLAVCTSGWVSPLPMTEITVAVTPLRTSASLTAFARRRPGRSPSGCSCCSAAWWRAHRRKRSGRHREPFDHPNFSQLRGGSTSMRMLSTASRGMPEVVWRPWAMDRV